MKPTIESKVCSIHSRSAVPMTQKQIAERLGTDKSKISRVVKKLVEKGIIVRAVGQKTEGNNVRTYALFINPNIIYSGERDNVEATLKALFINVKPLSKDFPVALFFRVIFIIYWKLCSCHIWQLRKSLPSSPCRTEFLAVVACRQADELKQGF